MTLRELEERGSGLDTPERAAAYERDALQVRPDDLATVIYTSGTTGNPKGAMLTHNNFHSELAALDNVIPVGQTELNLSFLPLSHVFQRVADYYLFARGVTTAYAESFDVVAPAMRELRPTVVCAVPRVYEKIYARVLETALSGGALKKAIFLWARGVGDRWATERLAGRPLPAFLSFQYALARALVFRKIKARTGGRIRYFVSGGAPLAAELNRFFYAAGLLILEGYGLTETTAVISVNTPEHLRIGTVGRPIRGVEVKIDADGEILTRGPHVMTGYLNKPEATRECIDDDGWFHSGDIGILEDGFIRITDRKKDLIVTAGGKKIAPQPIENLVKSSEYVTQAVMIGDRRKYPVLLLVPNFDVLEKWAKGRNIIWSDRSQLLTMPTVHSKMEQEVRSVLLGLASFESPKKIALIGRDFSVESGELTPTLKVKRRVVETNYRDLIDSLYAGADPAVTADGRRPTPRGSGPVA
jgi:long-chain acyl-CoA synthetase